MFLAQPLQLNRQGCTLFLAHFTMRHAAFGPNHARRSERLSAQLCKRAPGGASEGRTVAAAPRPWSRSAHTGRENWLRIERQTGLEGLQGMSFVSQFIRQ
jgi:hypothetical protein